jgi:hypothetical protein
MAALDRDSLIDVLGRTISHDKPAIRELFDIILGNTQNLTQD